MCAERLVKTIIEPGIVQRIPIAGHRVRGILTPTTLLACVHPCLLGTRLHIFRVVWLRIFVRWLARPRQTMVVNSLRQVQTTVSRIRRIPRFRLVRVSVVLGGFFANNGLLLQRICSLARDLCHRERLS